MFLQGLSPVGAHRVWAGTQIWGVLLPPPSLPPQPVWSPSEVGMSAQSCRYLLNSSRHVSVFKSPPCSSLKGWFMVIDHSELGVKLLPYWHSRASNEADFYPPSHCLLKLLCLLDLLLSLSVGESPGAFWSFPKDFVSNWFWKSWTFQFGACCSCVSWLEMSLGFVSPLP